MDLTKLFTLQKKLDSTIFNKNLTLDNSLLPKKILALQIKLGQLANSTNCLECWNKEFKKDTNLTLEKYVDCLCFLLSIGLDKKFNSIELSNLQCDYKITEQFLELYLDINDFLTCNSQDNYLTLFEDFFRLGFSLGFTKDKIFNTYFELNSDNICKEKVLI